MPDRAPTPPDSHSDADRRRAGAVYRAIERIVLELCRRKGERSIPGGAVSVPVDLKIQESNPDEASRQFADSFLTRLDEALEASLVAKRAFRQGRVYCYWCDSAECSHARPPTSRAVFDGYGPTGQPLWSDFVSVCLNRADPRIDLLYRERPEPFAIFQTGEELKSRQLGVFGRSSYKYRILAQVVVGYVRVGAADRTGVAMTLQAVEATPPGQRARIGLNVIGLTAAGEEIHSFLEQKGDRRIADAISACRRKLEGISSRHRRNWGREIDATIRRLGLGIERIYRQKARRTRHAQTRHEERERPAATAHRDARAAAPDRYFLDVAQDTVVVLGPKNRVHIFNHAGQHVTTAIYQGDAARRRIRTGKWRPLDPEAYRVFCRAAFPGEGADHKHTTEHG